MYTPSLLGECSAEGSGEYADFEVAKQRLISVYELTVVFLSCVSCASVFSNDLKGR